MPCRTAQICCLNLAYLLSGPLEIFIKDPMVESKTSYLRDLRDQMHLRDLRHLKDLRNLRDLKDLFNCVFNFLGGTASDTKRATNQKSFVKQDENKAVVKIHLYNGGDMAYFPQKWGKKIIFEKTIYETGQTLLKIKGESGHEARNVQDYKDRILEHFNIELNNPMTVLQQEEAKNFFKENDEKSLYEYFQRGSMLDAIAQTNKKTKTEIDIMAASMKVRIAKSSGYI